MKKKRHTTEEIIRILRKADESQTVEEVCREVNIRVALTGNGTTMNYSLPSNAAKVFLRVVIP